MEDWGESEGAGLALIRMNHDHQRSERRFQLWVVGIFSLFAFALVLTQAFVPAVIAKDVILVALPVFTFVLGKLDKKDG